MEKQKRFNLRSFTSFALVFSTIIMSISGFILYVAPPGRIANWTDWKLLLFNKAEWAALHTIFSYMFFILFVIHLFFVNWRTFLNYIKSKLRSGLNRKWELMAATFVTVIFFIGTLNSWTPFGPVMAFGEKVKEGWGRTYEAPPVAHMETYDLARLAADFPGKRPGDLLKALTDSGLVVSDTSALLKVIAVRNNTTPSRIYAIITNTFSRDPKADSKSAPSGVGKMTLSDIAARMEKQPADLVQILKLNGIEAKPETTMRTIADQMGISPHDVYSLLSGK
jgi:hypothetical protein